MLGGSRGSSAIKLSVIVTCSVVIMSSICSQLLSSEASDVVTIIIAEFKCKNVQ